MKILVGLFLVLARVGFADPGFYLSSDAAVPKAVAQAAEKAVRLWVFGARPKFAILAESVPTFRKQLEEGDYSVLQALGMYDSAVIQFYLQELAALEKGANYFLYPLATASGFFIEEGRLVTARHVFTDVKVLGREYFQAADKTAARLAMGKWPARIVITDARGGVRFDTAKKNFRLRGIAFSGHPAEVSGLPAAYAEIEATSLGQLLDVAVLDLEGTKTKDLLLPLAARSVASGDRVFAAGYPLASTGRVKLHKAPDADGASLRVSIGKALAQAPTDYQGFLRTLLKPQEQELFENGLLFTDLDFVPGSSGGAVLNVDGEVVAVASTVRHDPKISPFERYTVTTSYGPRLKLLSPLW